jgi:putative addiction module component (TIGR02574 family)
MMNTEKLISAAESLPLDLKTELIERLIESLNPLMKDIDGLWAEEAEKRVKELTTGKVKSIPGEEVFKEIRKKLSE